MTPEALPDAELDARCLDCGAEGSGAFCSACGQPRRPRRQSLATTAHEMYVEVFGFDGRFWRAIRALLFRPGLLTNAYLQGQRTRYPPPFKIYLSATVAFFFVLSLLDPVGRVRGLVDDSLSGLSTARAGVRVAQIDSALADSDSAGSAVETVRLRFERGWLARLPADSIVNAERYRRAAVVLFPDTSGQEDGGIGLPAWMPQSEAAQQLRNAPSGSERVAAISDLAEASISRIPTAMFVLLPVFALLLKLIYVRRGWYYSEHLAFAYHTHAFAFVLFTFVAVATALSLTAGSVLGNAASLVLPAYFVVAQKRVYGQTWGKTLVKAFLLGSMYVVVLNLGLGIAFLLAAALG